MNQNARILIIDDEPHVLQSTACLLKSAGYQVFEASSGAHGIRLAQEYQPDLILLDVILPDLDGVQVCQRLKAELDCAHCFILLMSDIKISSDVQIQELESGADGYIVRPIVNRQLLARVQAALRIKQAEDELRYHQEHLEEMITQRTAELCQANEHLQREIRERKDAEEALKKSEERFRLLYEHAPLGYQSLDENGCFLEVNQAWLKTLGYERNDVMGHWFGDFLAPESVEQLRVNFPRFKAVGEISGVEFEMVKKNGVHILVSFDGKIGYDAHHRFQQTHCILHDITDRKHAENERKLNELRLEALLELNQKSEMSFHDIADFVLEESIILTQSEVGFLGFMNDDESICMIHAWSESAMQGCRIKDRVLDFSIAASGIWGECVRQRHPFILNDYAQPHDLKRGMPEGHVQLTRFLSIPVFEGERIVAVLAVGNKHAAYNEQDIRQLTLLGDGMVRVIQRNQTQQELQYAKEVAEEANRTLREQQQHIQEQNQQLQELIGTKDKFFSIVAHDLKNPLSSFQSFVNLVSRNLDQWQPGEIQQLMGSLCENVDNLTALLDNLLTWARIEQGRLQLYPQKFDFEALALRNVELFRHMAAHKQIGLAHTISRDTFVYADLNTVDTVMRNLVSNALKFTNPGGSVTFSAEQETDMLTIAVTDTGVGMGQDALESIFRIDVQHQQVGTANEKGTGLGLILCKEFVEKNGGELWAESQEGSGSVFRFTLPMCRKS